jgi:hypothetical protein
VSDCDFEEQRRALTAVPQLLQMDDFGFRNFWAVEHVVEAQCAVVDV